MKYSNKLLALPTARGGIAIVIALAVLEYFSLLAFRPLRSQTTHHDLGLFSGTVLDLP